MYETQSPWFLKTPQSSQAPFLQSTSASSGARMSAQRVTGGSLSTLSSVWHTSPLAVAFRVSVTTIVQPWAGLTVGSMLSWFH